MEAIASPFLIEGAVANVEDLLLAIWLLSNDHPSDLTVSNLELDSAGKEWLDGLTGQIDMERDVASVIKYMADYYSMPKMFRNVAERPMTPLGCPWMLSTVVTVVAKLHIPLRDAWLMGIGQLLWYRCSIEEQESPDSRVIGAELSKEMEKAETAAKVFTLNPGETIAEFSARTGIDEETAKNLLHNSTQGRA